MSPLVIAPGPHTKQCLSDVQVAVSALDLHAMATLAQELEDELSIERRRSQDSAYDLREAISVRDDLGVAVARALVMVDDGKAHEILSAALERCPKGLVARWREDKP